MALYTYASFESEAKKLGLFDTLAEADIRLAKSNPDAGMSLLKYVSDYSSETNTSKKNQLANSINQLRSTYGGYKIVNGQLQLTAPTATNFNYVSPYADRIGALTDAIANRKPFSYDAENDPSAQAAKKSYLRESRRATEDAIAAAASMTGGIPSSYALTAGTQAGDYHASQFADRVQALEDAAYNKYLNENSLKQSELDRLLARDSDEKNAAYAEHMNRVNTGTDGNYYSSGSSYYNYGNSYSNNSNGSIFDVLPKPAETVTKPAETAKPTETPKNDTSVNQSAGNDSTSSYLPTPSGTPNYNNNYSGSSYGTNADENNYAQETPPTAAESETKPTENKTPSSSATGNSSGGDVAGQLPKPDDTPISSASGTTSAQTPDIKVTAANSGEVYAALNEADAAILSRVQFDKMKNMGNIPGQIAPSGVAKFSTYEEYLQYYLTRAYL